MTIWNKLICVWIGVICGAVLSNAELVLTTSPVTATDGELFTLTCRVSSGSAVTIAWLQNNTAKVITQWSTNCIKQTLYMENITRFSVSCNDTVHSIEFTFNSTTDQGGWQCGNLTENTYIYPRSNIQSVGVASPSMSTQSLPATTRNMGTTSEPVTVTSQKVSTVDGDSHTIYIVVGAVGGAVLLAVVVVGIVCTRWRKQAAHQKEARNGKGNVEAAHVYENSESCDIVENDWYERSPGVPPTNEAGSQEDDFIMSATYASVDMPPTCTPREQGASCDVDVDNLYAKPDKSKSPNVQQVSDIYAEVQKPKKKRQHDPKVSEDVNAGDVYAKPNKR